MSRPFDANLYAEIRKSTLEPDSNTPATDANRLKAAEAEAKHSSADDLTLIENYIYKNSAEFSKLPRNSYLPGECAFGNYSQTTFIIRILLYRPTLFSQQS